MNDTSADRKVRNYVPLIGAGALALACMVGFFIVERSDGAAPDWLSTALTIGFLTAVTLGCVMAERLRREKRLCQPMRAPVRRYLWRFMPAMLVYVVVLFVSMRLYRNYDLAPLLLWLVAIAPALPLIAAIGAIGLYLKEEDDEFQRALAVRSYVLATGLMLAITTVWGFLEQFGLAPHVPAWSAFPLLAMCLAPSQAIVYWRYR